MDSAILVYRRRVVGAILLLAAIFYSVLLYWDRGVDEGFVFSRLADLIVDLEAGATRTEFSGAFDVFPLAPYLLASYQHVLGIGLLDVVYLPIPFWIGVLGTYVLARRLFPAWGAGILIASAAAMFRYGRVQHLIEYDLGIVLYPLFGFILFLLATRGDSRLVIVALFLFIGIKFYSPHAEVWAIAFTFVFLGLVWLATVSRRIHPGPGPAIHSQLATLSILLAVGFLFVNPKIYDSLLSDTWLKTAESGDLIGNIRNTITSLSPSGGLENEFGAPAYIAPLVQLTSAAYYVVVLVALVVGGSWVLLQVRRSGGRRIRAFSLADTFIMAFFLGLLPDFIMMATLGLVQVGTFAVPGAILAGYLVHRGERGGVRQRSRSQVGLPLFAGLLVLSSGFAVGVYYTKDVPRPLGDVVVNGGMAEWLARSGPSRVMTGFQTFGVIEAFAAEECGCSPSFSFVPYEDDRYRFVINQPGGQKGDFDLLVVNYETLNHGIQVGHPTWTYYVPIAPYEERLKLNSMLHLVYESPGYKVYMASKLDLSNPADPTGIFTMPLLTGI